MRADLNSRAFGAGRSHQRPYPPAIARWCQHSLPARTALTPRYDGRPSVLCSDTRSQVQNKDGSQMRSARVIDNVRLLCFAAALIVWSVGASGESRRGAAEVEVNGHESPRNAWREKGIDLSIGYLSETVTNIQGGERELW